MTADVAALSSPCDGWDEEEVWRGGIVIVKWKVTIACPASRVVSQVSTRGFIFFASLTCFLYCYLLSHQFYHSHYP